MMSHLSKRLTKGHISKARFCWLFNKSRISLVDLADPKCSYIICLEIQPQSFVKINKYGLLQQSFGAKAVLKFFVKCRKSPKHFCMHEKSYPLNLLKSSPNRLFNSMDRVSSKVPFGLTSAFLLSLRFWFFFSYFCWTQRLLHCSWDMNSVNIQMNNNFYVNSNQKLFFIVFSFQQNKWYPNAH